MVVFVSDVFDRAAALCNDPAKSVVKDTVMLPHVQKAYDDLQDALQDNGINTIEEVSGTVAVAANVVSLTAAGTQPADLLDPIELLERAPGAVEWVPMNNRTGEGLPIRVAVETLGDWIWREDDIKFVGATAAREVLIRYMRTFAPLTGANSALQSQKYRNYMSSRTAALVLGLVLKDLELAQVLQSDADVALSQLVSIGVKAEQGQPVRRRPYRYNAKRR